ncbi:MAG: hypothetical protein C0467_32795 [Planctomycetaceae bacterium]|nr:hypothetical protein [Planctomycetaceae bacterium]
MTCGTAEPWLLAARSAEALPGEVRQHLSTCSHCLGLSSQLRKLHDATTKLIPLANSATRARLDAALSRTLQEQPPVSVPPRTMPRWGVRAVVGIAAALLVAGGWIGGRMTSPKLVSQVATEPPKQDSKLAPKQPPIPSPQPPAISQYALAPYPALAPGLVAKVARYSVSVATDPLPTSQLDALNNLAGEVRADAVGRAAAGDLEQLPRLVGLHERILKLGVARQLTRIPEQARTAVGIRLSEGLNKSAEEAATVAGRLLPVAAELLQPLIASCREVGLAARDNKPLLISPAWPSPATPLESLVAQTIRTAEAETPLSRADESSQLAAALAHALTVLAVADMPDDAARVGGAFDSVLENGVAINLERVEAGDPSGKLRKEVADVRERAGRATDVLERNLSKAPPAARAGLERALAASVRGRGKATGKPAGKGNGPTWKKDDHPGKGPPGWSKKP